MIWLKFALRFAENLSQIILVVALHYTFCYKIILNMVICHYSLQEHPYTWVFVAIKAINNIFVLEDTLHHPDNPDGFALKFKKIYDTLVFVTIKVIKNIQTNG